MKIRQSFIVQRSRPTVWALFQDIPAVSACMPGAELSADKGGGLYTGKVGIKLGPFNASFEGEAQVTPNPDTYAGHVVGRGTDKRGGSRSRLVLDYRLLAAGDATQVEVDADVQLSGPIAQFGRTGVVTETANILIGQFIQNIEAKFAATPQEQSGGHAPAGLKQTSAAPRAAEPHESRSASSASGSLNLLRLFKKVLLSYFRRLFHGG